MLYDETAGKPVRSLPKKGADPDKFSASAADLADMRKIIKKVARARSDTLLEMFLSGERQDAEKWTPLYMGNPILHGLARLVVWQQDGTTFTLGANGLIRSDGSEYVVTDAPIFVAHPMEMKPADIAAWQRYFVSNGLKQPFEQVWEPAIDPKTIRPDRYKGGWRCPCSGSCTWRNTVSPSTMRISTTKSISGWRGAR